ncbi:MAG: 3-dehydroquinate synthase [Sphaerochaetaceae bacterium]|nr:3-dehydroquinate synthase [Sphaerochaetaceae bacterium]
MDSFIKAPETEVLFAKNYDDLSFHIGKYGTNVLWVVDETTAKMVRPLPEPNVILPVGEKNKVWDSVSIILKEASRNKLGRDTRFIGFGGGVICDLTAFAASIFMRGCTLTLIPTTLLAMVDASLGGKTGIDFCNTKNLVGTFYPADEVLICPETLGSLPPRELKNGLAEVIKHSLLSKNDALYILLVQNKNQILAKNPETIKKLILLSLQIKSDFILQDPLETKGIRTGLNLGHTFAHALESHSRMMTWSHGESVAWGVCRALEAGVKLGITDKPFADGAAKLFLFYDYDIGFRLNRGEWLDFKDQVLSDKKKVNGQLRFVLLKSQGDFVSMPLDLNMVRDLVIKQPLA